MPKPLEGDHRLNAMIVEEAFATQCGISVHVLFLFLIDWRRIDFPSLFSRQESSTGNE